jgi:pSer/pThr/pTyr-binding forkhead associated (FHA) protein
MIGRVEGNLLIQDANLSRHHAQITFDGASRTYFITDLNSSNGSRLNGVPLAPGQAKQLSSGALINLGPNVVMRFDLA